MRTRGLGRVYKRGNVFWIQYSHRGKKYRESAHSAVRGDAVRLLRRRQQEMGAGRLVGPDAEKVTFEELAGMLEADYIANGRRSLDRAKLSITHLREAFGASRALDITPDRVTAYLARRLTDGAAPASIRTELAALKRMLRLGFRAGKLPGVPYIPSLDVQNTRTGFFEESEFVAVLAELPEHLRAPMEFAYLTGWRLRSEVLPLTWAQVDFAAGVVRLEPGTTKNGEGRVFPFAVLPKLAAVLRAQRERTSALERASGRIIPHVFHRNGAPIHNYLEAWHAACRRAAVQRVDGHELVVRPELLVRIPHDFRRTAVRNLERAGVSRSVAMKLTGHKTESVYRRYAIVAEADLREGVAKLAALASSKGTVGTQSAAARRRSPPPPLVQVQASREVW